LRQETRPSPESIRDIAFYPISHENQPE